MSKSFAKKGRYLLTAAILLILAGISVLLYSGFKDEAVATVGGEDITEKEFHDELEALYGEETLYTMISNKIVGMEAEKEKIKITDKEIEQEITALAESYGGEENFKQQLENSGSDMDEMEKQVRQYLQTVKLVEPRIKITDDEISNYFKENKDSFAQEEQVEASHILVEKKSEAEKIAKQLKAGGDFAELAKKYSTDTSAEEGGKLGFFGRGEMAAEFEKAAFSLKKGEISDIVKSEHGYHIIKVTDRKAAQKANLEDSRDEIEKTLKNERIETEYTAWMTEKQKEYDIYNSLKNE